MQILVRYGEIFLKGDFVRKQFTDRLITNIGQQTGAKVRKISGRLIAELDDCQELAKVLGIISFSPCRSCEKQLKQIEKEVLKISLAKNQTFAIRARRSDKNFELNSKELEEKLGQLLVDKGFEVDLDNPDKTIYVEIRDKAYIYTEIIEGPGGMPFGTAGKVAVKLETKQDVAAAWLVMRRGGEPVFSGSTELAEKLEKWAPKKLAEKGDCLGIIDSSTDQQIIDKLENGELSAMEEQIPVYYSLAGFSSEEIENVFRNI